MIAAPTPASAPSACLKRLGQRLERLMGNRIGLACSTIDAPICDLYPEELVAVHRAVPKRQREFAAGRINARRAMTRIGEPAVCIPSGEDRSPVWPAHLSGSISHTDEACVAVVALRSTSRSLGIDLEADRPLPTDLWPIICTPEELAAIRYRASNEQAHWALRLFSAKEAIYKWQYPLTGYMLDFHQVQLTWLSDGPDARFTAELDGLDALRPPGGRSLVEAGLVVSWVQDTT